MKLQKNQKRMLIILVIVLLYAVFDFVSNSKKYNKYYFSKDHNKSKPVLNKPGKNPADKKEISQLGLAWKRDPFTRIYQKKANVVRKRIQTNVKLELKAITFNAGNSFVIINDVILMEGEAIQGYLLKKIYKDRAELLKNGSSKFIYLNSK